MITKALQKTPDLYALHNVRVIDGDTIHATIPLPFGTSIQKTIRLRGWWAAELNTAFHAEAVKAAQRLHDFASGKVLWLLCPSARLDKYGRVIGHLYHEGRIISPREVLGDLQLSDAEHKLRSDAQRRAGKAPTTGWDKNRSVPAASVPDAAPWQGDTKAAPSGESGEESGPYDEFYPV